MNIKTTLGLLLIAAFVVRLFIPDITRGAEPQAAVSPSAPSPVKRTVLNRVEVPGSNYEVLYVMVDVPAHTSLGRHTHPGSVMGYVLEGEYTMMIEGQPERRLKAGESLVVPPRAVHDERSGDTPARLLAVFTVEKGVPLATPAP